jgi:hypothetical protein
MQLLGAFYREKVLSRKEIKEVELPRKKEFDAEIKIEPVLYGYRLHSDGGYIELDTEEEARYCKVFLEIGLRQVMVPENLDYLKSILPELEHLKSRHDYYLNNHMEFLFSRKLKRELHSLTWSKVMWKGSHRDIGEEDYK